MTKPTPLPWVAPLSAGLAFATEFPTITEHIWNGTVYPVGTLVTCWTDIGKRNRLARCVMVTPPGGPVRTATFDERFAP